MQAAAGLYALQTYSQVQTCLSMRNVAENALHLSVNECPALHHLQQQTY